MTNSAPDTDPAPRTRWTEALDRCRQLGPVLKRIVGHPLNKQRRLSSVARFFAWQVGSRLVGSPVIVSWVNGTRFVARAGDTGITGNLYCGLLEYSEMAFVLHATSPGDLFVDVGANVGAYTILACGAAGARGLAIEPIPATYAKLMDNLRLNDLYGRVRALNAGAGDQRGTLRFTSDEDTTNHVVEPGTGSPSGTEIEIPVHTIDELIGDDRASIVKMDVEGYELQVIQGACNTLRQARAVIVELNGSGSRYGHSDGEVVSLLRGLGYSPYRYFPEEHRLEGIADAQLGQTPNVIFIRDLEAVGKALARRIPFRVSGIDI